MKEEITIALAIVATSIFTFLVGIQLGKDETHKEAIRVQHAHWEANKNGDATFTWNK